MYGAASTAAPSRVIRASSGDSNGIAATSTSQMPPPGATARRAVGGGKGHARASSLGSISGVGSTARSQRTLLSAGAAAAKRQMPVSTASKKAAADDAARETMRALGLAPGSGTLLRSRVEEEDVTAPLSPQAGTETDASSTGEIRRSQASSSHASPPSARASRRDQNAAPPRATPPRKVSSQASPASSASKTQTGKGATRTGSSGRPSAVAAAAATAAADLELIRLRSQVSAQEDELTQLRARCHELEEDERAARTASPPKATFGGQVVTAKEMDKLSRDFAEQEKLITAYQRESEKHMVAIAGAWDTGERERTTKNSCKLFTVCRPAQARHSIQDCAHAPVWHLVGGPARLSHPRPWRLEQLSAAFADVGSRRCVHACAPPSPLKCLCSASGSAIRSALSHSSHSDINRRVYGAPGRLNHHRELSTRRRLNAARHRAADCSAANTSFCRQWRHCQPCRPGGHRHHAGAGSTPLGGQGALCSAGGARSVAAARTCRPRCRSRRSRG